MMAVSLPPRPLPVCATTNTKAWIHCSDCRTFKGVSTQGLYQSVANSKPMSDAYADAQITKLRSVSIPTHGYSESITMRNVKTLCASLLAILLITTVIGCAGSATQESTGEYIDDTWITTKVKASLVDDPDVKAREVNVETFKGVVQLSGFVESEEAMARAVAIAESIEGVTSVRNNMTIKAGGS